MSESTLAVQEPSVGLMLAQVIEKGVTADNVAVMGQLIAMKERMEQREAEKDFNSAFVKLQSELPTIVAQTQIPKRGRYERFEDVMRVVGPLLQSNGFAVGFSQVADDKRITVTCHLRHIAGHHADTSFSCRFGKNADSDTQADCKASTTAKRNSILQALNIVIRQDCLQDEDNASNEGGVIKSEEADHLRRRVQSTGSNEEAFLKFAEASAYETISTTKFDTLCDFLSRREKQQSASGSSKLDPVDKDGNFKF